jgi:1,4-dihydroxy-6-naphthoate synthase
MRYARDLDRGRADTFVGMYVNEWTLDYGERGRRAVHELLERGVRDLAELNRFAAPYGTEFVGPPLAASA